jgi:hypothetical protein
MPHVPLLFLHVQGNISGGVELVRCHTFLRRACTSDQKAPHACQPVIQTLTQCLARLWQRHGL